MVHILYVDDNLQDGVTFSRLATKRGYKVTLADNGSEGLDTLNKGQYDIAVLDYCIPGICGDLLAKCVSPYVDGKVCYLTGESPSIDSNYEFFSKSGLASATHPLWQWIDNHVFGRDTAITH